MNTHLNMDFVQIFVYIVVMKNLCRPFFNKFILFLEDRNISWAKAVRWWMHRFMSKDSIMYTIVSTRYDNLCMLSMFSVHIDLFAHPVVYCSIFRTV